MRMEGDGPEGQPTEGVQSLEDVAGLFGGDEAQEESELDEGAEEAETDDPDEEEAEAEAEEQEQDEPAFTIKVDGKEVTVKQSEALELAQKGLDYTKKTMALGDEKRAVEAEREEVRAVRQEVQQKREQAINDLRVLHAFMEEQIGQAPDISLLHTDAHQYLVQKEWHEGQRAKLGQLSQALNVMLQQQEAEQATQRQQRQAKVERELIDTLPGWKDAPAEKFKETADYVQSIGLTPDDVGDAALTTGFWQLAHKAREYDRLMAEKSKIKPVQSMPKVAKPGASNPISKPAAQKARKLETLARRPNDLSAVGDLL